MCFHVGSQGEALIVDTKIGTQPLRLTALGTFRDQIIGILRGALDADDVDGAEPGSTQQVELLRGLARQGYTLYQALEEQLPDIASVGPRIQLVTADDDVVPIEFVYDYGLPTATATLCKHWQDALETGTCRCRAREGEVRYICPLGFWGLRFVIEREVATVEGAGPGVERALGDIEEMVE